MIIYKQSRINDPKTIDFGFIDKELGDDKHVIVQFSGSTYNDKMLSQLNDLCEKYDNSFGVRFYGNYSSSFDFKTLLKIPKVKCLYVDCLTKADNIGALTELNFLQKLSLGVFELKETEILNSDNLKRVTELILIETKTKVLNLDYLKDYKGLKILIIGGHVKNIESVGELSELEYLSFNSVKKTPVQFVNNLKKLKTLNFILGGRENINEIKENNIENLDITWVRGFNDLSNISKFNTLKILHIEDNIQLNKIQFDKEFHSLIDLKILNCKTLDSLIGLDNLKALKELVIYKTNLDFDSVLNQSLPKTLETFVFCTTKSKIDSEIKKRIIEKGFKTR
jgi:protein phosphatase 1 regulatory subunit 7